MSSVLRVEKVVSALPGILEPDTIYAVRVGAGFDFYMSDTTGAAAHRINQADGSFPVTQALHGFTVGKFVELGDSGWTSTLTKTGRLRGMVSSVLDSSTFSVQRRGIVTGLSGLTPGATLYSSSSGVVGETPSFWGAGAAISATSAEVEPWLPAVGTSVQFWDEKASGVSGGGFASGDWRIRTLNEDGEDPFGLVSRSGNLLTPVPGYFEARWFSMAYAVGGHQTRLYDSGNSSLVKEGSSEFASNSAGVQNKSVGEWIGEVESGMVLRIDHRCNVDSLTWGLGNSLAYGKNIYTQVTLTYLRPV